MEELRAVAQEYAHGNARMIVIRLPECKAERFAVLFWKARWKVTANQRLINELLTLFSLGAQDSSRYRDFEKAVKLEFAGEGGF